MKKCKKAIDIGEVLDLIFMADGQIIEEASPAEFFDSPRTDRAKQFLKCVL